MAYSRLFLIAALLAALPAAARADDACGPPKIVNVIHMLPTLAGDAEIIPIAIGGKQRVFLLDTGGLYSQISRPLAEALKLPIHQTQRELFDMAGNMSRDQARLPELTLGQMRLTNRDFMISTNLGVMDGLVAPDILMPNDAELDFSNDTLNLFSPDHCTGKGVYWDAPAMATVPITLSGTHITVLVDLDGQRLHAEIDTGAPTSTLRLDEARERFGLTMGSADTPFRENWNGDETLKTYSHMFKKLSFGDVTVSDPRLDIVPSAVGRRWGVDAPEVILGMDVLRRLHIYLAFRESKMYVTPPSAPSADIISQPYDAEFLAAMLQRLDDEIAVRPDDAEALNDRCFWRSIAKTELEGAMADCDKSLALAPGVPATLDSRAFVLFQQGKYQDALVGYNAALVADPRLAPSLWMRGLTKEKLGDRAGKDADIIAAEKDDPNIEAEFKRIGVANDGGP